MTYSVQVLKVGEFPSLPGPELYWMSDWDRREPLYVYMAVLRGEKTIVVNTGAPYDLLDQLNDHWGLFAGEGAKLRVREDERPERALAAIGLAPEDVDFVVLTPLQAYSVGNVDLFRRAQICISRTGWIAFHAPRYREHPHDRREMVLPQRILVHLVTEAWPRLRLIDGEEEIAPGVTVFWTGVHHRASMAVSVATTKGRVEDSNTYYAQGGLAAVEDAADTPERHVADTLAAACEGLTAEELTPASRKIQGIKVAIGHCQPTDQSGIGAPSGADAEVPHAALYDFHNHIDAVGQFRVNQPNPHRLFDGDRIPA